MQANHKKSTRQPFVARFVAAIVGALLWPAMPLAGQSHPDPDQALVEIGDQTYTVGEFQLYLRQVNPRIRYWELPASEQRKHLDQFVERKLWAREARRAGLAEDPETRAKIDFFTDGVLATGLKGQLQDRIQISRRELKTYYNEHPEKFLTQPRYHLQHLLYPTPEDAVAAREKWSDKVSFRDLASQRGQPGGPILVEDKWLAREILLPELEQAARNLEVGEISQGIYTSYGYHLLKLLELEPARRLNLEESRSRIEVQLRRQESRRLYQDRLERLREEFQVKVHLP